MRRLQQECAEDDDMVMSLAMFGADNTTHDRSMTLRMARLMVERVDAHLGERLWYRTGEAMPLGERLARVEMPTPARSLPAMPALRTPGRTPSGACANRTLLVRTFATAHVWDT